MIKKKEIYDWIKEHKYTIILFTIIFVFSLIFRIKANGFSILKDIFFAFLGTSLIYAIIDLFISLKLRWIGAALLSILITTDVSFFYLYQSPMNYGIIASIFETNMDEVMSMADGLWFVVLILLALFVFLLIRSTKEMKTTKRIPIIWAIVYLFVNIAILPIVLEMITYRGTPRMVYEEIKVSPSMFFGSQIPAKYPFIIGDFLFVYTYIGEMKTFAEYAQREKNLPLGVTYDESFKKPTKIVLIIGESAQREQMSLYGYSLKTTPFMDSLSIHTDQLTRFDSVISPAAFTREAIKNTLSYSTPRDKQSFWDYKNLVDLANDAGYKTVWISNQSRMGLNDSYAGRISESAKEKVFNNELYKRDYRREDLSVINPFKSRLNEGVKEFFVIHLMGSHWSYSDKYDDVDTQALGSKGATIEYDKSIHHTDRVLAQIYEVLDHQSDDFLMLYYSDHAEVVNLGHAISNRYKEQFRIPLVLISDTLTTERYAKHVNRYYNEETKRVNSSNLIYFLGEIMGYFVSESAVEKMRDETEYIFQVDGSIKRYSEIKD